MAAMVQSLPQPTSTMTMLQARPSSSEAFQNRSQNQQHQQNTQMPRNIYNTPVGGMATGNYRGQTSTAPGGPYGPVGPYAFQSTPMLSNGSNPLRQHPTASPNPRLESRTASAPSIPLSMPASHSSSTNSNRPRPPPMNSTSSSNTLPSAQPPYSKEDAPVLSTLDSRQLNSRPLSTLDLNPPSLQQASYATVAKSSPDRYRRNHRRAETSGALPVNGSTSGGSAMPSGSGMATVGHLYSHPVQSNSTPTLSTYRTTQTPSSPVVNDYNSTSQPNLASKDDINLQKERQASSDLAKRYRRRSISSLEAKDFPLSEAPPQQPAQPKTYAAMLAGPAPTSQPASQERKEARAAPAAERPTSAHGRNGSNESTSSYRHNPKPTSAKRFEFAQPSQNSAQQAVPAVKNEAKAVNIPARGSSEANKKVATPSPLSKPIGMSPETKSTKDSFAAAVGQPRPASPAVPQAATSNAGIPESPAAQHLAALNKKEGKKDGKSSRLRRAFSFGSAAELRKASAENSVNNASTERAKLRKERYQDEQEAQQAAEIQKQEAGGLGEGIYSGQGHFFTGSTDNLSISSTASSASVMIRKMGKGVKKGSRSLVGLFRPKSVVGVPAADSAVPEPSVAQVSMVTVEAEREKVNVNANPHDQVGGGTGFPKLERNSMDAVCAAPDLAPAFSDRDSPRGRRSIVGGEEERAKVLAAVKKGILKRTGTDSGNASPVSRPADTKTTDFHLPQVPTSFDSPHSSAPSTPVDHHTPKPGHRRTDSVNIEGDDYFLSIANFANGESTSMPGTPKSIAAAAARNISFSPRIQFHDTWPSGEYDRRGEIATCNRLTPMLAQQIKEELNTFKMVRIPASPV
ncbi:bud neck involved protein [Lecanora helva]